MARNLGLALIDSDQAPHQQAGFHLAYTDGVLSLGMGNQLHSGAISVDFANSSLRYRVKNAVKSQAIAKAVGVKPGLRPSILDATAGLGRDAYLLASMGCQVELVEKSPVVFALLEDGMQRARHSGDGQMQATLAKMSLTEADFMSLPAKTLTRDVIYLDPMFPVRRKSARVKKEMFVLQQLLDGEKGADGLLRKALEHARRRVVVKRSKMAGYLADLHPSFELRGKSSRYDVYITA